MAVEFDAGGQWERVASELRAYRDYQQQAWGDIDNDSNADIWYISSVTSTTSGVCPTFVGNDQNAPGLSPKLVYNDVDCP